MSVGDDGVAVGVTLRVAMGDPGGSIGGDSEVGRVTVGDTGG